VLGDAYAHEEHGQILGEVVAVVQKQVVGLLGQSLMCNRRRRLTSGV
jgi:hypothetical protein